MVRIDKATAARSTERLSLRWRPEGLVLGTWPAELKKQAEATYRTGWASPAKVATLTWLFNLDRGDVRDHRSEPGLA